MLEAPRYRLRKFNHRGGSFFSNSLTETLVKISSNASAKFPVTVVKRPRTKGSSFNSFLALRAKETSGADRKNFISAFLIPRAESSPDNGQLLRR